MANLTERNRRNAAKSTGPKSAAGKATSSQNARKHGLASAKPFIPPDQRPEYLELKFHLMDQLQPQGALEHTIFDQLVDATWNLRRIAVLKAKLAEQTGFEDPDELLIDADPDLTRRFLNLERYAARNERSFARALRQFRDLQTSRILFEEHDQELCAAATRCADTPKLLRYAKRSQPPAPARDSRFPHPVQPSAREVTHPRRRAPKPDDQAA